MPPGDLCGLDADAARTKPYKFRAGPQHDFGRTILRPYLRRPGRVLLDEIWQRSMRGCPKHVNWTSTR